MEPTKQQKIYNCYRKNVEQQMDAKKDKNYGPQYSQIDFCIQSMFFFNMLIIQFILKYMKSINIQFHIEHNNISIHLVTLFETFSFYFWYNLSWFYGILIYRNLLWNKKNKWKYNYMIFFNTIKRETFFYRSFLFVIFIILIQQ